MGYALFLLAFFLFSVEYLRLCPLAFSDKNTYNVRITMLRKG